MKYRVIRQYGKEVLLQEDEVQRLTKRYDPKHEQVECVLCLKYRDELKPHPCDECPVHVFEALPLPGCEQLTQIIVGEDSHVLAHPTTIASNKHTTTRREALKIKRWLENLPTKEVNK